MAQLIDAAEGIQPRKRRKEQGDIDITPMIDIVFLLLSFFVIVSKMDPAAAVKMPKARYGDSVPDASCVVLVVAESDTDAPMVYLGKGKEDKDLLQGEVEDIADAITDYVLKEIQSNAKKTAVLIKAERQVKSRHVALVKDAVSAAIRELSLDEGAIRMYVGIEEE